MNKQNKAEYERCKKIGLLHRLDLPILKEFGTKEEIEKRTPKVEEPKEEIKPQVKPKGKK